MNTTVQEIEKAQKALDTWALGQTSKKYETGNRGPATISTGKGDHGGVSYGSYQLSTNVGTLQKFLDKTDNYHHAFDGLKPATPAFNHKWKELAHNDPQFARAQHDFIAETHYKPAIQALDKQGYDFSHRGKAIQDMVWSTSVQYGSAVSIIKRAQKESGLDFKTATSQAIITAVQDSKLKHVDGDFRSSKPDIREGIKHRIPNEKKDLLKLNEYETLIQKNATTKQPPEKDSSEITTSSTHNIDALPPKAQKIYTESKEQLEAFYQKNHIAYQPEKLDNAALALAAAGYKQGMRGVSMINIKDGEIFIGDKSPNLIVASVNENQALITPPQESINQIQQTQQAIEKEGQNRQMEQSHSHGMSR